MRFTSLLVSMLASAVSAQDDSPEARLAAKLRSPFFAKAGWITDYDKAREASKESARPILAYFTRSDAPCGPCKKIESSVLETDEFAAWSTSVVLFCHITSKVKDEKHPGLLAEKGGRGFPFLAFLDAAGEVLAVHSGERTVEAIKAAADRVISGPGRRKKAAEGDAAARFALFAEDLEAGVIATFQEAEERLKDLADLTAPQKEQLAPALAVLEAREALQGATRKDRKTLARSGKACEAMRKGGRIPTADRRTLLSWWQCIIEHGLAIGSPTAAGEAIEALEAMIGDTGGGRTFIAEKKKELEAIRKGD